MFSDQYVTKTIAEEVTSKLSAKDKLMLSK